MGSFGIKAGQFLRTSGLATGKLKAELDGIFDRALPPDRPEVIEKLKKVFGEALPGFVHIRQVVGSGSVNYVVLVDVRDPKTGKIKQVIIRVQRDGVEGKVANENEIWESAVEKLHTHANQQVRSLADVLAEARAHAYETLKPGGAELDLGIERRAYGLARKAYDSPRSKYSKFRIEAVKPDEALQAMVPEEYSKSISVYAYIPATKLDDITDRKLRRDLSRDIVAAELEALFVRGIFDPDGHPGNWLVDLESGRLVRIDYAQILAPEQLEALKKGMTILLSPELDAKDIRGLARNFHAFFAVTGDLPGLEGILTEITASSDLPSFQAPHERLLFLMRKIEAAYHAQGKTEVKLRLNAPTKSMLSSLGRTAVYGEHIGDLEYANLLAVSLGLNRASLAAKAARASIEKNGLVGAFKQVMGMGGTAFQAEMASRRQRIIEALQMEAKQKGCR